MEDFLRSIHRERAIRSLVPLFFISGATSLVYETLWGRALHLVFGTSTIAIATVLAAFMAGLALGGFLASRVADKVRRPLRVYGLLEAGIGLYALAFPFLLKLILPIYLGFWRAFEPPPTLFALFQFLLVGLLLLFPTSLMGATLPILARFVTTRLDQAGKRVGLLYGVNTGGAVAGTFLAGFVLLPQWGLHLTTWAAVACNLLLAAGALLLDRRAGLDELPVEASELGPDPAPALATPLIPLVVAGLAGVASLACEMAWFRLMSLTLGASAYAFSLMLLGFLVGIAFGGWAGGPVADHLLRRHGRAGPLLGLAGAQIAVGVLTYGMMWIYPNLPYWYVDLYSAVEPWPALFWPAQLALAGAIMIPPTLFMGATFPLAVRALVTHPDQLSAPVGRVYAINTVGGILGSAIAAFVFLPYLHVTGTLLVTGALNALAALLALEGVRRVSAPASRRRILAALVAVVATAGLAGRFPPPWDPMLMTAGMFKYAGDLEDRSREGVYQYAVGGYDLLYYDEGLSSVVTVARTKDSGNIWLANNGKVDASTTVDMPTQILVSHLPFFFGKPLPQAAIIGLASGISAGSLTLHPDVEHLDIIELEPAITQASHYFDNFNNRPLQDPRVRLHANDGRNHILLQPEGTYDLIVSEPSNPWLTGVSNLFTLEFFQMGKRALKPGGIWTQWVQMYGMDLAELRSLIRTFHEVFPNVVLFATIEDADLVLVGSDDPLVLDIDTIRSVFDANPILVQDLLRIDIRYPHDILALYQADRDNIESMTEGAPFNTDDNMRVEFSAPRHLYHDTSEQNYLFLLSEAESAVNFVHTRADCLDLARSYIKREEWVRALLALEKSIRTYGTDQEMEDLVSYAKSQLQSEMKALDQPE